MEKQEFNRVVEAAQDALPLELVAYLLEAHLKPKRRAEIAALLQDKHNGLRGLDKEMKVAMSLAMERREQRQHLQDVEGITRELGLGE